ncbi:helix-turn-helix domain-containing protein [[Clostridium] symbiosum]|uniref:helix-turn-helix domain-containing protein n=1 Tax=Clostridium symbiosum TaxID=1512 RepID=UPI00214B38C3|nr:hypothetical protein [[Clostridium] symbiosum]MCR1941219.1 hypothetical protein [[Clostridium] symbiosum]
MLYTTFIRLCDEAVKHNEPEEFIMNLGWQEWMDKASDTDEITKDLSLIFELAGLDFPGLRKRLNVSMAKMSAMYHISLRTIENWEAKSSNIRNTKPYIMDFIRFTIFVREREGDDGYLGRIAEQD